jgi:hypothetical protein
VFFIVAQLVPKTIYPLGFVITAGFRLRPEVLASTGTCPSVHHGETLAKVLLSLISKRRAARWNSRPEANMINLEQIKITRRDQQVPKLLVQGCSNKGIAAELKISPCTVKQHLRTLFLRAGIKQGRKRVILATAIFEKEQMNYVATRAVNVSGDQSRNSGLAGADESRNRTFTQHF